MPYSIRRTSMPVQIHRGHCQWNTNRNFAAVARGRTGKYCFSSEGTPSTHSHLHNTLCIGLCRHREKRGPSRLARPCRSFGTADTTALLHSSAWLELHPRVGTRSPDRTRYSDSRGDWLCIYNNIHAPEQRMPRVPECELPAQGRQRTHTARRESGEHQEAGRPHREQE